MGFHAEGRGCLPMLEMAPVAIVDYGLGNVFSVLRACERVGLRAQLTNLRNDIASAPAVILPGVGAFGDAMTTLTRLDLVSVIQDVAASGKPLIGICLGLQLLMSESYEFGRHKGLGIIEGDVIRLRSAREDGLRLKVPQVGWNRIQIPEASDRTKDVTAWQRTLLEGLPEGEFMYFVHSYHVRPVRPEIVLSMTVYGSISFCSSIQRGNVFATQFHPERSGPAGLLVYANLKKHLMALEAKESYV